MKIKDLACAVRGDAEYCVTFNGNAYPFDPNDAFMLCAYGDFEVACIDLSAMSIKGEPIIHVELELSAQPVKEVRA